MRPPPPPSSMLFLSALGPASSSDRRRSRTSACGALRAEAFGWVGPLGPPPPPPAKAGGNGAEKPPSSATSGRVGRSLGMSEIHDEAACSQIRLTQPVCCGLRSFGACHRHDSRSRASVRRGPSADGTRTTPSATTALMSVCTSSTVARRTADCRRREFDRALARGHLGRAGPEERPQPADPPRRASEAPLERAAQR